MSNAASSTATTSSSTRSELAATLTNPGPTNASTFKGIANAVCLFGSDFLASWTAYSGALVVCHPIDTLRLRKQTYGQSVAYTIRHDGVRSLYAGALTPLFATGPLVAVAFALNEVFRVFARWVNVNAFGRAELANAPYFTIGELVCGGAMAGATTSVLQCPVTFTRVQQQTSARAGRHAPSATQVYRSVVQFEGVRGMWRAFRAEASAGAIGRASYFSSYEVLKGWFSGVLGPEQKWLAPPRATGPARAAADAAATSATTSGKLHVELPGEDPLLLLPPNPMHAGAHRFVSSTVTRNVAAASVTSTLGWVFIFPLEVVKVKLQADAIDPAQRRYKGILDCSRQIMREQGMRGFWVGFCLSITRSWISSGLALPLFEYLKPKYRAYAPKLEE